MSAKDKDKEANKGEKVPPAFVISRQLDQEKINFLTKRIEELLKSNQELRAGAGQNEKDTHDIVLYFQREMEIKDDIILKLNEELVKCQTQLKFDVERVRKNFEEEMSEVRATAELTISGLASKVEALEDDLKSVEVFRREREQRDDVIRRLERDLQQQREQLIDAMEQQERRFLEEKSRFLKELDEQKAAFREVALHEARAAMGEEVKKILAENTRMFEELKFHHSESIHSQTEKVSTLIRFPSFADDC
jgi:chromosome segregation ATPase